ncbi:MAG: di-heme oxidoredictase family protein [Vicinamibacterales bacterium]
MISVCIAALAFVPLSTALERLGPPGRAGNSDRFRHNGIIDPERVAAVTARKQGLAAPSDLSSPTEAPTGFDDLTNGFDEQGPAFETINEDSVVPLRSFNDNRFIFEEVEAISDGLGPTYNAQSCRECHQNVVTGGASQVVELRTGRVVDGQFFESLGGSLLHSRSIHPDMQERGDFNDRVRAFRLATNTLGGGFVEAISNQTLLDIRDKQPAAMRGMAVPVPVLESNAGARIGRFGWKSQHASLESFSADAYLNEMGITSPLFPRENTSTGRDVAEYDPVADPEDDGIDIVAFANFMRSTKAPSRGPIGTSELLGELVFHYVGCGTCHTASIITAAPGMVVNAGAFMVPPALGNKVIHPFSDFLLHDIGTGDGIPVLPGAEYVSTTNQMRTAPLWGLRTRNRLMHDGQSLTVQDAVLRHGGQAAGVTAFVLSIPSVYQSALLSFLNSL